MVVPGHVQRGSDFVLRCLYDLDGDSLYSVKWYKGSHGTSEYSNKSKYIIHNHHKKKNPKSFKKVSCWKISLNLSRATYRILWLRPQRDAAIPSLPLVEFHHSRESTIYTHTLNLDARGAQHRLTMPPVNNLFFFPSSSSICGLLFSFLFFNSRRAQSRRRRDFGLFVVVCQNGAQSKFVHPWAVEKGGGRVFAQKLAHKLRGLIILTHLHLCQACLITRRARALGAHGAPV